MITVVDVDVVSVYMKLCLFMSVSLYISLSLLSAELHIHIASSSLHTYNNNYYNHNYNYNYNYYSYNNNGIKLLSWCANPSLHPPILTTDPPPPVETISLPSLCRQRCFLLLLLLLPVSKQNPSPSPHNFPTSLANPPTLPAHPSDIYSLAVTRSHILSVSGASSLNIHSTSQPELPLAQSFTGVHKLGCHHVVTSADGKTAATVGFDGLVRIWSFNGDSWVENTDINCAPNSIPSTTPTSPSSSQNFLLILFLSLSFPKDMRHLGPCPLRRWPVPGRHYDRRPCQSLGLAR